MSQTVTPRAAPGGAPAPPASPPGQVVPAGVRSGRRGPVGRVLGALRDGVSGTPGRLRLAAGAAIVAALIAGVCGGAALRERSLALEEAKATAANLVLLQGVRTDLVQADAEVTNAFLRFGLEPSAQSRSYAARISAASSGLASAAGGAAGADVAALGEVNDALTRYTGLVAAARANNRQGLPVGANFLRTASGQLRDDVLPTLNAVTERDADRVDAAYDRAGRASAWLAVGLLFGVGTLIVVQVWLAHRSRRVLNVPAAIGTGALVLTLAGAALLMEAAQEQADDARRGGYTRARTLGEARVAAFDAKSNESLTLIVRGSGTAEDPVWTEAMTTARGALREAGSDSALRQPLDAYHEAHVDIRTLDNRGDWDAAVREAVATGDGSANAAFQRFAQVSANELAQAGRLTAAGLDEARGGLLPMAALVLLVGILAAGAAWWGISLRLDEYR